MAGQTFVEADIWTVAQTDQGNVVLVRPKGSNLAVPIFIGQLETQSILIGMGGVDVPRPLTHDLAVSLVAALGSEVLRIEINDLREGTFFARIVLQGIGKDIVVDSRPSDAIGIAVRAACPVFIAESVVEEAGISVNLVNGTAGSEVSLAAPGGDEPSEAKRRQDSGLPADSSADKQLERLRAELETAILVEDYERAAKIRDALKDLE
ncbi:MAG: bifunctional nuclease family protein [Spirochaetaceae bacterium]|nr:bifunctional nuclease family protein [Spirochaetaceae bacterium]